MRRRFTDLLDVFDVFDVFDPRIRLYYRMANVTGSTAFRGSCLRDFRKKGGPNISSMKDV